MKINDLHDYYQHCMMHKIKTDEVYYHVCGYLGFLRWVTHEVRHPIQSVIVGIPRIDT